MAISFAPHFIDPIARGTKTVTSRLIKAADGGGPAGLAREQRRGLALQCPWRAGDRVRVTAGTEPTDLELEILDVAVKFVSEFTDAQAALEGFASVRSFCDELARIYGGAVIAEDRLMWVISFRRVQ
jgi:hypothetical protein